MADIDEDNPHAPFASGDFIDLSDETQDFRFLNKLSDHATIPKRGEKDFEPHGTTHQSDTLAASRAAMHAALAHERSQTPKAHLLGTYDAASNMCTVARTRGPMFKTLGRGGHGGSVALLPEETVYLCERGSLDVRLGAEDGLPLSLQAVYALLLGRADSGLTLQRYQVYAGLKRGGYIVSRAPDWGGVAGGGVGKAEAQLLGRPWSLGMFWTIFTKFFESSNHAQGDEAGPLVKPGIYRDYTPPPPDFRIAVVDARTTSVPTLAQISALLESTPYDEPPESMKRHFSQKLRHGYRNVMLAVVDQGVVSYLRLCEAGFGQERIFERIPKKAGGGRGGKGGGCRRGRGVGRGSGGGRG
ncbi:MAG: tRNA-splicing endonuclease subunit sen54 [Trizodia sp. TS-e1964]|nr:MAG: tRNA-splicing endonuclease subunit sen54 [Trizodia sp. TS-e1964]